jgi:HME family heavy-metal exporter
MDSATVALWAVPSQGDSRCPRSGQGLTLRVVSHDFSGTPAAIAISVFGEDLDGLRRVAKEIESAPSTVPSARDVNANREVMITSLPIEYDHAALAAVGLTPSAAAEQVRDAFYGETVATVNQGIRQLDIAVRLDESERDSIADVEDVLLHGADGRMIKLRDVARIGLERSSNLITRENARRKAVVSLDVAEGSNLGDLIAAVRAKVDPIVADAGFTVAYGGQFEAKESATRTIGIAGVATVLLMFMLLQIATGSLRAAFLVMANMPLALIGGIAAIFLAESPSVVTNLLGLVGLGSGYTPPILSIASLVGFITLFGIAVRNGILLVNHYQHVMQHEGRSGIDAVYHGSMERLVPILMTALSAALGLVPLALALGRPGSELLAPLAIVVLGGLVSSTVLNLFVVPAGYSLMFRLGRRV